jgi:hypothetical protein
MATSKRDNGRISPQGLLVTALGLAAAAGIAWLYIIFARPPQMGVDEQAFGAVDALFTQSPVAMKSLWVIANSGCTS